VSGEQITGYIVAIGLGAILVEIIRSFVQRKQMGANAAKTITEAATTLLAPLQARVKELEATVALTQTQLTKTQERLAEAQSRLNEAHNRLDSTLSRLEDATRELEHLRARVAARELVLDERDAAEEKRNGETP
jgi:peptidoglycan hydrolase CwlO-like protein